MVLGLNLRGHDCTDNWTLIAISIIRSDMYITVMDQGGAQYSSNRLIFGLLDKLLETTLQFKKGPFRRNDIQM